MSDNLKHQAVSGIKWNAIGKFGHQGIQFFVSLVLARLLAPEEFGLISMLLIFMSIANVFIDSGLGLALIQKKECSDVDFSTVFYFNIAVSLFFYLLLFFLAPLIANFYNQPIAENLTRLQALIFFINSFGMVQGSILARELNFRKINLINLAGVLVSAIVAIIMAINNFGVYSIVGQHIAYAIVTNAIYWITSDWVPKTGFNKASFKKMFGFSSKILISNIFERIYASVDSLLVAKIFSPVQLGYYSRAQTTRDLPINNTTNLLTSTLFPVLSKMKTKEHLQSATLKIYLLVFYITFPIMMGLIFVAKLFVVVLFSEKWLPSVPMLQILCAGGVVYPLSLILCQAIVARGETGVFLKLEIYKKIIGLISMCIGLSFGMFPFVWSVIISGYICLFLNVFFACKVLNNSILDYFTKLLPTIGTSIIMGACAYAFTLLSIKYLILQLILCISVGVLSYFLLSKLFRINEYIYLEANILDYIRHKFKKG